MMSEDAKLVIGFVKEKPGQYSPTDLIKKLRLHYIDNGQDDPELVNASSSVEDAINSGQIETRDEGVALGTEMERVYPKS